MRTFSIPGLSPAASVVGLGTMIFHPDSKARDFEILDAFVAAGGTYIDTAEVYGAVEERGYSETVIGEWLAARPGVRDRILLTSKGLIPGYCAPLHPGGASIGPAQIGRAITGSLARLRADRLDLWMFHRDDPALDVAPLVDALDEEIKAGRIKSWGASNWTSARLQQAIDYARRADKAAPVATSPHFSLARANEPYWPDTVVADAEERAWFAAQRMPLVAWSSLGRGFFARGREGDESDADLARVFYSPQNFARKRRLEEFARAKERTIFEIALAWAVSQEFPVVALCGPQSAAEAENCARAGDLALSAAERDWLDLASEERPF